MKNNYKQHHRLYLSEPLSLGAIVHIDDKNYHHLLKVLRMKINDEILVFNSQDGEFLAKMHSATSKQCYFMITKHLRSHKPEEINLNLFFAPIKKNLTGLVIEKSVELGVHQITQIITEYTNEKPLNYEKAHTKIILATQQSKRIDIPLLQKTLSINEMLKTIKSPIFWLNENKIGKTFSTALNENKIKTINILIGPEGGFSDEENEKLTKSDFIIPCYFNTNILKSDTAAITALINAQILLSNF